MNNGGNGSYGAMYNGSLNGPTIGGVNGAGNVVGGFQSGGVQHFQNGAFEVGGFQRALASAAIIRCRPVTARSFLRTARSPD